MENKTTPVIQPPILPKRTKQRTAYWLLWGLVIVLAIALIYCGFSLHQINGTADRQAQQITSQQQMLDGLSTDIADANSTIAQQESDISGLQEDVKNKDKSISSYQKQVEDLTSKYNKLIGTKSQKTTPKAPKYATTAVTEKTCYLTFDDGPSDNTLKILDILKKHKVKATFFVIGTKKLSYVKRIHQEGHTVALHSYSHNYSQIYRSQKAYFSDLQKINDAVKAYTGEDSMVMRFPGGSSNTVSRSYCRGIMTALTKETVNRGYVYFDWNVDSTDASGNNVAVSKIMKNIRTYGGHAKQDVVLMHDTDAKDTTVQALPQIIEFYIDAGYTFAPLTTATPPVTHGVNN